VGGGPLKVGVGDTEAPVGSGQVRPPVALRTTQRFSEQVYDVPAMPVSGTARKEAGQLVVCEQSSVQLVHGRSQRRPATDGFIDSR
jgi:hypothetical protein